MHVTKDAESLTLKQLGLMAHAIKFRREDIKYNRFKAYRNHFTTYEGCSDFQELEKLVELKFMNKRAFDDKHKTHVYWVTALGFTVFEYMFNCKVIEID